MSAHASAAIPNLQKPSPTAFTSGTAILVYVALARIILYLFAAPNYGYFRDELYYLACAQHPAWGYIDQPPLIAWVAWLLQHTIGTSLWALRLLPALADAATIVLAGLLARTLGGQRWAIFLAALAVLMAPVLLAISHLFTMNAFDPLLWTAIAFLLVRLAMTGRQQLWLAIGALVGITILNKYSVLFWLSGVILGIFLTPLRASLRQRWFWLGSALATAISLPNFLWQRRYHFPFLQLMHNVRSSGKDVALPPLPYLQAQAQALGFAAALLAPFALLFCFSKSGRSARVIGWAFLVFLTEMMLLHGKVYYVAPVYPMVFAAGAVWLEAVTRRKLWVWAKPSLSLAIVVISGIYIPTLLPILSVPHFLAYERTLGIQQQKFENEPQGTLPQLYADMFGWQQMVQRVAAYYRTLSPQQQQQTAIFGNNYGEAGAIDFFGPKYGLPKAISTHQNYWIWGPRNYTGASVIVLGEHNQARLKSLCTSYSIVGHTGDQFSRPDERFPIYHCIGLKQNLQTLWPQLKKWQ